MGSVTGVNVAPANAQPLHSTVSSSTTSVSAGDKSTVLSSPLLESLVQETRPQIVHEVQTHPASIAKMLVSPPSASATANWWAQTPAKEKDALITGAPTLVGNLDGVPYGARARANAIALRSEISATKQRLTGVVGKGVRFELVQKLDSLQKVKAALKRTPGGPERSLWILDSTAGSLRAAIVIGDIQTAHFVSYLVPGMYMGVDQQLEAWATTAQTVYTSQVGWLHRTAVQRPALADAGVATVAWIGYQTPALMNIGGLKLATEGANYLEHSLAGLIADRASNPPYITVVAHSYGSTAALIALQRHTVSVDALVLLGSPGSDAQSVAALDVKNRNVYVGQAALDPIVHSAFFGSDPGAASYGAHPLGVSGGIDPIDHQKLGESFGHNAYFTPGTESMRNLALVGIGLGSLVMTPTQSHHVSNSSTNAMK